jgi:RNA polymerase-binding transcription factor DksA
MSDFRDLVDDPKSKPRFEALLRLAEGTYGACSDCGQAIVGARLQALPFAERCRSCEEAQEEKASAARRSAHLGRPVLDPERPVSP